MSIRIVPANIDHIQVICDDVRAQDVAELMDGFGRAPAEAMIEGMAGSLFSWTAFYDERPICMFGVAPISVVSGEVCPWLVGTKWIDEHPLVFLKASRRVFREMLAEWPSMRNWVDSRNTKAIEWAKWLGFEVESESSLIGDNGSRFHKFEIGGV